MHTVNSELKMLRMLGPWLVRRAKLDENPFLGVQYIVDDGPPRGRSLTLDDFGAIVLAAELPLRRWLLVVGLHGLRRGEADHLRPVDINIEEGYLDICIHRNEAGKVIWKPKFGIERKVPIVEAALPLMRAVRELPTDKLGQVFGVHDRRKAFARGLLESKVLGHVRFHDFRHTAYTQLKEAALEQHDREMALADMRLIFGHADRTMDRVYDHRTVERLRKLMTLMPLVEPVKGLLAADQL
jgi:integrase